MDVFSSGMEGNTIGFKIRDQKSANQYQDTKKSTNISPNI